MLLCCKVLDVWDSVLMQAKTEMVLQALAQQLHKSIFCGCQGPSLIFESVVPFVESRSPCEARRVLIFALHRAGTLPRRRTRT